MHQFLLILGTVLAVTPNALEVPNPVIIAHPRWTAIPKVRHFPSDTLYTDILSRVSAADWYGDYGTTAHEVTHLLNNRIGDGNHWGYYVGGGRAAVLPEPQLVMSDVAQVFPESARGGMYEFYVVGLPQNEPFPMVLLDEWTAYYNDVRVQMQLIALLPKEQRVSVAEQLAEFCVIGLALHDAVERRDPSYLPAHPEFSAFVAWLLKESLATYDASQVFDRFQWEEKYMTPRVRRYLNARLKMFGGL